MASAAHAIQPSTPFPRLFQPLRIRGVRLKNRIMSTGHDTTLPTDGLVNDALIAYHEARARQMRVEEEGPSFRLHRAGIAGAKRAGDRGPQITRHMVALAHDAVTAVAKVGDKHRRAAGAAFGVQCLEDVGVHHEISCSNAAANRLLLRGIMALDLNVI